MASKRRSTSKPQTRASLARSDVAKQEDPKIGKFINPGAAEVNVKVTWNQKHSDFVIILKTEEELRVHKFILAANSPVFDAMLEQDMKESHSSRVKIDQFGETTVISFLEYIYSQCGYQMFKSKDFNQNKFTVELMSMAHYYEVESLVTACAEYLKVHINDGNVMEIWMEAEKYSNKTLCAAALEHLVERPKGMLLRDVPGFQAAFQATDKPIKDLVSKLMDKVSILKEENAQLKVQKVIKITLNFKTTNGSKERDYYVHINDTVSSLLYHFQGRYPHDVCEGRSFWLTKTDSRYAEELEVKSTFLESGISKNATLYVWASSRYG